MPFLTRLIILATLLMAASAGGQDFFDRDGFGGAAAQRGQEVEVRIVPSAGALRQGDTLSIAVVLDHAPHWHTWPSADQDVLPEEIASFALRTEVGLDGRPPDWISQVGPVQWPEPSPAPVANPAGLGVIEVPTYQGEAVAYLPLMVSDDAAPGEHSLDLRAFYQACDDKVCLAPETVTRTLTFTIVPAGEAIETAEPDRALFADFDPSVFAAMRAGDVAGDGPSAAGAPATVEEDADELAIASGRSFFGLPVPTGEGLIGILMLALLSALGGFILNLTPCVLPVIPIKVMTISQHAGSPGKSLMLGTWMAAGVVAFWLALGLPVAFVSTVTDPSRVFGFWWVTLGIGLLIALMGIGIMGLFTINLPKQAYMVNPKADTPGGSFAFGVMTAVLGLPCFGFVAGALLAGAATLPPLVILIIFASLGVGMAAPYLVLSARPGWVEKLPRTGPASELVKQVMGLLLLAAAAYFIGSGLIALVSEQPWMARQLHWWAVTFFALIASLWLIVRTFQITARRGPRLAFTLTAVAITGAALLYTMDTTSDARQRHEARAAAMADAGGDGRLITTTWIDYSENLLQRARDEGYVVVLDFTAEWCLNCKALKATVLEREPVRGALANGDVVAMTVDLTSTRAPGWEKLRSLGQTGIPLLVVYGPGLETPWQSNAYTAGQVMAALDRARGSADVTLSRAPSDAGR